MRSEILKEKNPALRRKALFALRSNKLKVLAAVLAKDPSSVVRHEAAFLLGETKSAKAVGFLIQAIKKDKSDLVRHEAIEALGDLEVRNKKTLTLLSSLQKDKNPFIRDTAEIALLNLSS